MGTFGGSEDHTAILDSQPGRLGQYSYCPVRLERRIVLPESLTFAIASSGVVAEKTGAARDQYNRASRMASAISDLWRAATGRDDAHLAAAVGSAPKAADNLRELLRMHQHASYSIEDLLDRFEHFYAESQQVIPAVAGDLSGESLVSFGDLVDRSQLLAERLLHNVVPETSYLARSARQIGAAAASAFGAGFGGSVWALVEEATIESFLSDWRRIYIKAFPESKQGATFFVTRPGPAAFSLSTGM